MPASEQGSMIYELNFHCAKNPASRAEWPTDRKGEGKGKQSARAMLLRQAQLLELSQLEPCKVAPSITKLPKTVTSVQSFESQPIRRQTRTKGRNIACHIAPSSIDRLNRLCK